MQVEGMEVSCRRNERERWNAEVGGSTDQPRPMDAMENKRVRTGRKE